MRHDKSCHILLAITLRHHNMLEEDTHALDHMKNQAYCRPECLFDTGKHSPDCDEYVKKCAEKLKLEKGQKHWEGDISFADDGSRRI